MRGKKGQLTIGKRSLQQDAVTAININVPIKKAPNI